MSFQAWNALVPGRVENGCRAVVIIPARNEEGSLGASLDAFAAQVDGRGNALAPESFEILLLLNNCTDGSAAVATGWKLANPEVRLHVIERRLAESEAFVGTARRMLMDTAWHRLVGASEVCAILSTDSDTVVARDWIARNMAALEAGVDAVGGAIALKPGELQGLPAGVRRAYLRDRRYQRLVAELEDRLDPQEWDRWPRHIEHFGASLACTPEAYARAGGMPAVSPLEDVRFVGELRRVGAKLRHDPEVRVYTSARVHGRVEVGLSGQLKIWQELSERGEPQIVLSGAWLAHRFRNLRAMRAEAVGRGCPAEQYLAEIGCERLIGETFCGEREGEVARVNRSLEGMLRRAKITE